MIQSNFKKQVSLLLDVLNIILNEDSKFALKGGTAINLFYQNMPRLSVDIDLAYIALAAREVFLVDLELFTKQIQQSISRLGFNIEIKTTKEGFPVQLRMSSGGAVIKIETNLIIRGTVYPSQVLKLCPKAEQIFSKSVQVPVLSFEDIYGGKFCAALDRQHPRDLFDVLIFLSNYEITEKLKKAFLVYLLSHNRPIHELLAPNILDLQKLYEKEFVGMTDYHVPYAKLAEARELLIRLINQSLTDTDRKFLLSFKRGAPNWTLLGLENIQDYPAIK